MGEASEKNGKFGDTGVIELTGKIMVVAIVLLFFVVVFVFCLHIYTKWFWYRRQENSTTTAAATRRRHRLEFAAAHQEISLVSGFRHGLDPEVLKTIPVIVFDPKEFKDGFVCAVCLCEVSESEKTRLLPKCNHGFHVDCIDMWFQSHSTCPLCRNPVDNLNRSNSVSDPTLVEDSSANIVAIEVPNFPTNVLIWGNETQVSTFGSGAEEGHQDNVDAETSSSSSSVMASTNSRIDGVALIDIPWPICEEDEQKSPIPMRLRSLKRLLSGN